MSEDTARGLLDQIAGSNEGPWISASIDLASRVEKVTDLHHAARGEIGLPPSAPPYCAECKTLWPCKTQRLLDGEDV